MSPRSLLLSSDRETSHRLAQALQELDVEVQFCTEIFDAIKHLTSRSFDVVVADWDDDVEASFLLKTARELRANADAFTILVAASGALATAKQAGAHLVFTKPVLPGYVKYTLLTCEDFLQRSAGWEQITGVPRTGISPHVDGGAPQPQRGMLRTSEFDLEQEPGDVPEGVPIHLSFGTLESGLLRAARAGHSQEGHALLSAQRARNRYRVRQFLWGAAMGVALISGSYVFSRPDAAKAMTKLAREKLRPGKAFTAATSLRAVNSSSSLSLQPAPQAQPKLIAAIEKPSRVDSPSTGWIQVAPVQATSHAPSKRSGPAPQQTAMAEDPTSPPEPAGVIIPESIKAPEGELGARERATHPAASGSLLAGLEPVKLNEDLSEKMLLTKVQPSYPEKAVQAGLQGSVVLQAWIRKDGTIRDLKLIRGPWLLAQAACDAVKQWRYKPYLVNGKLVEAQTYVTVNFNLP